MKKFKIIDRKYVDTVNSEIIIYEHEKTGAKVVYHNCDDIEKSFTIQFRTLPKSDNGICHILEHSVLSGSRKYNVKEPFVNLLKGSLNTFLNAMTYPDKTIYPFATTNEKELLNLMDVYLDAVFFPNIYRDENILAQEGWHYEIDEEGKLFINGVVYNEMKGALSQPEQKLYQELNKHLFDNVYGVESGGDPKSIPELTQEEFLNFHKRYYHPSNSISYLYGKMNIENQLAKLDEFFSEFERQEPAEKIEPTKGFDEVKTVYKNYPVNKKEQNQCYIGIGMVQGSADNLKDNFGLKILSYVLFSTNIAPIRNMVLDSGLAHDIYADFDDSILQPLLTIAIRGAEEDNADTIIESIFFELERLRDEGIDRELLQAAINILKFAVKEGFEDSSTPKGIIYAIDSLSNYDRNVDIMEKLDVDKMIKAIEEEMDGDYFESLIDKYYLNNNHRVNLIMTPNDKMMQVEQDKFDMKMDELKSSLSEKDIEDINLRFESLKKRQMTEDAKEDVESIPKISSKDIDTEIERVDFHKLDKSYPMYKIDKQANGISYVRILFKQKNLSPDEIKNISILTSLIGFLGTKNKNHIELNNEIMKYTGGIGVSTRVYDMGDGPEVYVQVSMKYLDEYMDRAISLMVELIKETVFEDSSRILNMLNIIEGNFERRFIESGNVISGERLVSYFDEKAKKAQNLRGIDFYEYIKQSVESFEDTKAKLSSNLEKLFERCFGNEDITVFYLGDDVEKFGNSLDAELNKYNLHKEDKDINDVVNKDDIEAKKSIDAENIDSIEGRESINAMNKDGIEEEVSNIMRDKDIIDCNLKEGFIIPSEVNYISKGYNFKKLGYDFNGSMIVARKIIETDYLWEKVRVVGGAYGCSMVITVSGNMYCSSYRDPNVVSTLKVYDSIGSYLKELSMDDGEMDRYIVGTISDISSPISNSARMEYAQKSVFENITNEFRQKYYTDILNTKIEDIRKVGEIIEAVMDKNFYSAVGSQKLDKEAGDIFDIKKI